LSPRSDAGLLFTLAAAARSLASTWFLVRHGRSFQLSIVGQNDRCCPSSWRASFRNASPPGLPATARRMAPATQWRPWPSCSEYLHQPSRSRNVGSFQQDFRCGQRDFPFRIVQHFMSPWLVVEREPAVVHRGWCYLPGHEKKKGTPNLCRPWERVRAWAWD